ncbi:MAG: molybdate ABC transporter substrate-binding protein [Sulfitobacter sp.]
MRIIAAFFAALFGANMLIAEPAPITVFAAASLRTAMDVVVQGYDGPVHLSYGGSGTMARQVAAGAPADVVILANIEWMDWIDNQVDLIPGSRVDLIANQLVLIGPASKDVHHPDVTDLISLLGPDGRLAMGQRDAVPAGIYAQEWLEHTNKWDSIKDRLAETDNVRAALALVARGQAPIGIVYASDVVADPAVRILAQIPDNTHSPIVYPAAALTARGQVFLKTLMTPIAQDTFVAHGFFPVSK